MSKATSVRSPGRRGASGISTTARSPSASGAYRELLEEVRLAFPQPVRDIIEDPFLGHSILQALDEADRLKSQQPILGRPLLPDFEAARGARLRELPSSVEEVSKELVQHLEGLAVLSHPLQQRNVMCQACIPAIIGSLLATVYNPNVIGDEYAKLVAQAELECVAMVSDLMGYDSSRSGGVFTFGGTGAVLYGARIGLEKACPGTMREGLRGAEGDVVLLASEAAHYCRYNVAGWMGLGSKHVLTAPMDAANAVDVGKLAELARQALRSGCRIAAFIATMGTTDAFGVDDIKQIVALRDELVKEFELPYRPHVHADAVVGWAWSVFDKYDLEVNELGFRRSTVRGIASVMRCMRHCHLADSIGIDFHKTGFAPYVSSLFLVKDASDFRLLSRAPSSMPYLHHFDSYHPGSFTLETSRSGTGILSALAALRLFGRAGMRAVLGHLVEMTLLLRELLDGHEATMVLNRDNYGPVTVFRVYPPGVDTFAARESEMQDPGYAEVLHRHNEYNRRVARYLHDQATAESSDGRGLMLSMTECYRRTSYGAPVVGLKSFILSPFVDEEHVQLVVSRVLEALEHVSLGPSAVGE